MDGVKGFAGGDGVEKRRSRGCVGGDGVEKAEWVSQVVMESRRRSGFHRW